jgi:hypothetical protein
LPCTSPTANGSEFIAVTVKEWLENSGVGIQYIEQASPWQNPYVESLNGRLRDECLNRELFSSLLEAQVVIGTGSMEPVRRLTSQREEYPRISASEDWECLSINIKKP